MNVFSSFDDDVDQLSQRNMRATMLAGELGQHAQSLGRLVSEHLYVYDGDLSSQDRVAAEIAETGKAAQDGSAKLRPLVEGTGEQDALEEFNATAADWGDAVTQAIDLSRKETVTHAKSRDGSRNLYVEKVSPAMKTLERDVERLQTGIERASTAQATAVKSRASSTSRLLIVVLLVALALSSAIAVLIIRSVVKPVRGLMDRLASLNEHCLQDLTDGLEAAAQGDFTHEVHPITTPLDVTTTDELGKLGAAFNGMLSKVQRSVAAYMGMRAELGSLIGEVSRTAGSVSSTSQQVASTSDEAGRAVGEIASAVGDVAQGAERQVRMVESTRAAVQEAARAAGASAEAATQTAEAADEARRVAREGVEAAGQATSGSSRSPTPPRRSARRSRPCRRARSASAGSSPPSPASPSRRTCSP